MTKSWFKRNNSNRNKNNYVKRSDVSFIDNQPNYGYFGIQLYFPEQVENSESLLEKLKCFENYIKNHIGFYSSVQILHDKFFNVDYKLLVNDEELISQWADIKNDIINDTEYCLNCLGLAMHQLIYLESKHEQESNKTLVDEIIIPNIQARLINTEPVLQLKDLKVQYYGKLVTVRGTIIKAGHVKLICQFMVFSCSLCTGTQVVKQIDGAYTVPMHCQTKGCRAQSNFVPVHSSQFNKVISWQTVKIQELLGTEQYENARVPRILDCELMEDLVKTCIPGDDVTVTGIIKVRDPNSNNGKNKQNTVFNIYLEAISVWNDKKQNKCDISSTEGITFDMNDYYLIQEIHSQPSLFRLLVQSLCPNIYGHEIVKAGLILSLLGGTRSETFRAESHVLMVGDPGLGKSQMLQACANVAPRGVYVCGNTSTSSGLTVTITRDAGEYALEAGALMLADQGCCCIDEFDKMPSQHACLLEAMEQQSISIAKAGIVCNLPTRSTILAAANPSGGHYNKSKTIAENLRMSSPLLSRFDLIFILLDQSNEQLDQLLSRHVLGLHTISGKKSVDITSVNDSSVSENPTLRERLKNNNEKIDYLPLSLFRKYIAYAQKYVKPQLSEEARELLKLFYLSLRKQFQTGDCTPVTTRQLNSLIRLTQARAKAELREEATKDDAADVIEIMKFSLVDIFTDNTGTLDKTRSQNGTGMSTKKQAMHLLSLLQRQAHIDGKSIFTLKEIKDFSEKIAIDKIKFYNILQSLNIQGFLLNKGNNKYQLITAEY